MRACCWCIHYHQAFRTVVTELKNVSGGLVEYRSLNKHRCNLKQEDKYPKTCNFEEDKERVRKANQHHERIMKERSFTCSSL